MGKAVLITGSSSGIGKEVATLFQRNGWNVAAGMRQPSRAIDLDRLDHLIIPQIDVTNETSIRKAVKETIKEFGGIDVVVNNAGYGLLSLAEAADGEQIRRQMETNLFGAIHVIRAVLPHFRERRQGTIVNVTSVAGRVSTPLYSYYNASKWALEGFSEALYHELMPLGIRVKIVEPGPVKTDFAGRSRDTADPSHVEELREFAERVENRLRALEEKSVLPLQVARVVYRAATSSSRRLRYAADRNARLILLARRLLPDAALFALIRRVLMK